MSEYVKAAVIGAGITGLYAGHRLAREFGVEKVTLLEAADSAGGYCRTERFDGFWSDVGPNGFLDKEPLMLEWIKELGLSDSLIRADEAAAHRFILKKGRLLEIAAPPKFFLSSVLSAAGRSRLFAEPFVAAKRDGKPESIWDFAARRIGREAADTLVQPMVTGIFGGDAKQLSLAHCFPRLAALEREHGSLLRGIMAGRGAMGPRGTLTTLRGGIGLLTETAAEKLGSALRLGAAARSIQREGDHYQVAVEGGNDVTADAVILALPPQAGVQIASRLDPAFGEALAIPSIHIVVVFTAYRREDVSHDLNGFGFLVPRTEGKRVLGCIWASSVFPECAPEGYCSLRTMIGGAHDPGAAGLTDDELLDIVAREVHPVLRIGGAPAHARIYRHRDAIPQYTLEHQARLDALARLEDRHPRLVLAGNAYTGVGLNDCVVSAKRAVDRICAAGGGSRGRPPHTRTV